MSHRKHIAERLQLPIECTGPFALSNTATTPSDKKYVMGMLSQALSSPPLAQAPRGDGVPGAALSKLAHPLKSNMPAIPNPNFIDSFLNMASI